MDSYAPAAPPGGLQGCYRVCCDRPSDEPNALGPPAACKPRPRHESGVGGMAARSPGSPGGAERPGRGEPVRVTVVRLTGQRVDVGEPLVSQNFWP
jgi:hypothetical protein